RNHLHHGRIRHRGNPRPPDRAPRQRRQPTRRRPVPDLAVSPVFHQLHRACPPTPISPTAATRSSKPPSPISSTDPWPTFLLDGSEPTLRARYCTRSRITCYARPRPWPAPATAARVGRPCAVTWSTSPPAWPDPNANRSCTYPPTGPGNPPGSPCGTTPSADDPAPKPPPTRPDNQDPDRKSWADQRPTHAATSHNQDQPLNPPTQGLSVESGLVHGAAVGLI